VNMAAVYSYTTVANVANVRVFEVVSHESDIISVPGGFLKIQTQDIERLRVRVWGGGGGGL